MTPGKPGWDPAPSENLTEYVLRVMNMAGGTPSMALGGIARHEHKAGRGRTPTAFALTWRTMHGLPTWESLLAWCDGVQYERASRKPLYLPTSLFVALNRPRTLSPNPEVN